jgi:predicted MPP superfamily phosphohydrolase
MNLEYLDKIELAHSKLILRNDQIVEIHLEDNFYFTLKESLEINEALIKITKSVPHKIIVIAGDLSLSDSDSRNFASTKKATDPILAMALLTKSLPQKLIANFIVSFQKPLVPTRAFSKIEDAEKWHSEN